MNVGYCTNIHSGASLNDILNNLQQFTLPVKQAVSPDSPMGIGLWFSASAVKEALEDGKHQQLKSWLDEHQLVAHTFNAFPYDDFHQPVVKKQVYKPNWTTTERAEYTNDVAQLMCHLLPSGFTGTISTLPLGWPGEHGPTPSDSQAAQKNILASVAQLRQLHEKTGVQLRLCIEPEPGCLLQQSGQVCSFMNMYLFSEHAGGDANRPYLGVCHDVCHASVVFELQEAALDRYQADGIQIGKVQISSALQCLFTATLEDNQLLLDELREFAEERYLHQTNIRGEVPPIHSFDDLWMAIQVQQSDHYPGLCRTHYHVPINLATVGNLDTTQYDIGRCLNWFVKNNYATQFEVETYAWEVSPQSIKGGSLVDSIVGELTWLANNFPTLNELNQVQTG